MGADDRGEANPGSHGTGFVSQAILEAEPASLEQVAGMTVLERMITVLDKVGVRHVVIQAAEELRPSIGHLLDGLDRTDIVVTGPEKTDEPSSPSQGEARWSRIKKASLGNLADAT